MLLAGSGSNLPLARQIAARYRGGAGRSQVRVADSIGTRGAVRAVVDEAVDVGLASRPLSAEELAGGVVQHPMATAILGVVVHQRLGVEAISLEALTALYERETRRWPKGEPVALLLREDGDSNMAAVARRFPRLHRAMVGARESGAAVVLHTDQEMRDALLNMKGAIGLLDVGIIELEGLPLRPLTLGDAAPTPAAVRSGRYPLTKPLYWLTLGEPSANAADFLRFATAPETLETFADRGYLAPRP